MTMNTLAVSSTLVNSSRPIASTSLPQNAYIIAIAPAQNSYAAAASLPTSSIHLFDKAAPSTLLASLPGHQGGISALISTNTLGNAGQASLVSCGKDGQVNSWDERSGEAAIQMKAGKKVPLLSCDVSPDGLMVAAGTALQGEDASILYWDPRNPAAPLRRHTSTHSDDITAVHFSPSSSNPPLLLSASTDGLVCTSNPLEDDEDEAGVHVANWRSSVSKAGWIPAPLGGPRVWAVSDMETVSFWSEELDQLHEFDREKLAHPDPVFPWVTDYIVDCHISRSGSFHIFAGSNEGDVALLSPHDYGSRWVLEQTYTKCHTEIVRCTFWDEQNGVLLTGGEDSRINVWSSPSVHGGSSQDGSSMDVDSPSKKRIVGQGGESGLKRMRTD